MNSEIAKTGLWAISLGSKDADQEIERKKELLRSVLLRFREHASVVTSRISATFPDLTVHDVTHLDALWETASLIAGENYPLNPLEAFVFGGAILLHDAAHCFEAYEGGQLAVRSTLVWKDALASETAAHPNEPREKLEPYCDFTAIRLLHARQAEKLGEREWKSENDSSSFFLIENADLRSRYGALIGQIAASHNWSIDDVKSRLRAQVNAPGNWPSEWRVDPIKIACLLRCADAAHIDSRRAPDFLLALIRRSGVSLDHWKAQNWLSRVDADQSDPTKSSLLFTSTHAFKPSDANAWWIAFDAVSVLDAEIRASNNLLLSRVQKDSSSPAFKMLRPLGWHETVISADLDVTLKWKEPIPSQAKKQKFEKKSRVIKREKYLDGHKIDYVKGKVAFDLEWNSKDQTFDRDLFAMNAFFQSGAIDVGVLVTRSASLDDVFKSVGPALTKKGAVEKDRDGNERPTMSKYGASTTWMGKLIYRLNAGRNGGCPVLAVGITPKAVKDCTSPSKG